MLPKFTLAKKNACVLPEQPLSFDELMHTVIRRNKRINSDDDPFSLPLQDPPGPSTPPEKPKQPIPQEEPVNPPMPEKPRQPVPQEKPQKPGAPEHPPKQLPPEHPEKE